MSLRVIAFDGGWNLPVWAAQRQGFLRGERRCGSARLHAELGGARSAASTKAATTSRLPRSTTSSAYQEGQGEAKLNGEPDFVVVMGGDGGFLSVVGGPGDPSFRSPTLTARAMKPLSARRDDHGTAFSLAPRARCAAARTVRGGRDVRCAPGAARRFSDTADPLIPPDGKHDATTLLAARRQLLAREAQEVSARPRDSGGNAGRDVTLELRQGGSPRSSFVGTNEDPHGRRAALVGFLRAYRQAVAWSLRSGTIARLAEPLAWRQQSRHDAALAKRSYDLLLVAKGSRARRCARYERHRTVLTLRSKYGGAEDADPSPFKYVDETCCAPRTRADPNPKDPRHGEEEGGRARRSSARRHRSASRVGRPLQSPGHTQVDFGGACPTFADSTIIVLAARAPRSRIPDWVRCSLFDQHNIRYITSTVIASGARQA